MHVAARARLILARRPSIYWAVVAALATVIALTVHGHLAAVDAARADWGSTRTVHVATRDLEPGDRLETHPADVPVAMVAPAALAAVDEEAIVRQRVAAGEVLTEFDVAAPSGPAARAPLDSIVVGVIDPLVRQVAIGAPVRIAADGNIVAENATVVDLADDVVFVAVDPPVAALVASAAQQGIATLLYVP